MNNVAVKYGVAVGVIGIVINLLAYFIDPSSLFQFTSIWSLLGLIVPVVFVFLAAKKVRELKGGYIPFGEAFVPGILTYAIGTIITGLFSYILMTFIDPSLQETALEVSKESARGMFEMAGMSEAQIEEEMEKMSDQLDAADASGLGNTLLGILGSIVIFGLPISAIVAAIVKKQEPMPQV